MPVACTKLWVPAKKLYFYTHCGDHFLDTVEVCSRNIRDYHPVPTGVRFELEGGGLLIMRRRYCKAEGVTVLGEVLQGAWCEGSEGDVAGSSVHCGVDEDTELE
jgi:hypothetical protein